jgi:hypothetical protein
MEMDRIFTCPACGYETAYQPEEYELLIGFMPDNGKMKAVRYRLIRCAG